MEEKYRLIVDNISTITLASFKQLLETESSLIRTDIIYHAIKYQREEIVDQLLRLGVYIDVFFPPKDTNINNNNNNIKSFPLLCYAALYSSPAIITTLIENGVSIRAHDTIDNRNFIHCMMYNPVAVEILKSVLEHPKISFDDLAQLFNEQSKSGSLPIDLASDAEGVWNALSECITECKHYRRKCMFGWRSCKYLHFYRRPNSQEATTTAVVKAKLSSSLSLKYPISNDTTNELIRHGIIASSSFIKPAAIIYYIINSIKCSCDGELPLSTLMLGLPAVGVEVVKKLLEERKDLFIFRGLDVKCTESAFRHIAPSITEVPQPYVSKWEKEETKRKIFERTGGRCYLCKTLQVEDKLIYENYSQEGKPGAWNKEHVLPKSRFPEHDNISNWLPAHIDCNSRKGYHDLRTFVGEDFDILTVVLNNESLNPEVLEALKTAKEAQFKKKQSIKAEVAKIKPAPLEFWKDHHINIIKHSDVTLEKPALGKGAFGIVYKGLWCYEQVAIKELRGGKDEEKLFQQEVMGLYKNNSNHIVRLVGICVPPDPYALVLEFMAGGSLSEFIRSEKYHKRTIADRVGYVLDLAIGMYHIHRQGIVHRDLKPHNVLLTEDKKHCKIADFGLAKEMHHTFASEAKGSLSYMPPEAFFKPAQFSFKTDIYAFGICMYELWTGELPYDGEVLLKLAEITKEKDPLRPLFPPSADPEFVSLASLCWSFSPSSRPSFDLIINQLMGIHKRIIDVIHGK